MIIKAISALLFLAVIGATGTYWFVCPCETIPGGPLSGETANQPIEDWSFVNERDAVPLCQIEVDFPIPRSMNVNCMSPDGDLFVSCSRCADKQWAAQALEHPNGFVRAAGVVYPITYERVLDEAQLDAIWTSRLSKLGREPEPRPDHWWSFQLKTSPLTSMSPS